jgi:hypothetical protein
MTRTEADHARSRIMNATLNSDIRELTADELDRSAGGLKIGALNLNLFDGGFGVSIDGVGGIWVGPQVVCASLGTKGGCIQ